MRFLTFFLLFLPCIITAQVVLEPDSIPGRYRFSQRVESESLDSTAVKDRLFNSLVETYSAIARLELERERLEKQVNDMRQDYIRFDSAGYFKRAGAAYNANFVGDYQERTPNGNGNLIKNIELRLLANGRLQYRENAQNTGTVRVLSPHSFVVAGYFKTGNTAVDVTFFQAQPGLFEANFGNKKIRLRKR